MIHLVSISSIIFVSHPIIQVTKNIIQDRMLYALHSTGEFKFPWAQGWINHILTFDPTNLKFAYHRANLPPTLRHIVHLAVYLECFVSDHATPTIIEKLPFKGIAMHVYGIPYTMRELEIN